MDGWMDGLLECVFNFQKIFAQNFFIVITTPAGVVGSAFHQVIKVKIREAERWCRFSVVYSICVCILCAAKV